MGNVTPFPRKDSDSLVDGNEVAEYLGVHYKTICRWATERRLPSYKIGGAVRFRMSEIRGWVAEQRRRARA